LTVCVFTVWTTNNIAGASAIHAGAIGGDGGGVDCLTISPTMRKISHAETM
jgi:hypothetical protein